MSIETGEGYFVNAWFSGWNAAGQYYGLRWQVQGAWLDKTWNQADVWFSPKLVADNPNGFFNFVCQRRPDGNTVVLAYSSTETISASLQDTNTPKISGAAYDSSAGRREVLTDDFQLEDLGDGTNVYWSSTCEGNLK